MVSIMSFSRVEKQLYVWNHASRIRVEHALAEAGFESRDESLLSSISVFY